MLKTALPTNARDEIVAKVLDDMRRMPKAQAERHASDLYSAQGLVDVKDPMLKTALCRALADYFDGTTASALTYWRTFK